MRRDLYPSLRPHNDVAQGEHVCRGPGLLFDRAVRHGGHGRGHHLGYHDGEVEGLGAGDIVLSVFGLALGRRASGSQCSCKEWDRMALGYGHLRDSDAIRI